MLLNFLVVLLTLCEVSTSQSQKRTREASPRRAASPVDAFGTPVPSSLAIPDIPQALPPARLTSTAGYLELELVLGFIDLEAECEVFRNDADDQDPSLSCFRGSCVSIVRLPGLKVDAQYAFTMQIVRRVRDPASGLWFEFHGQRSRPITFVTAGLPDWQLAIPQTTSLGSIVMRLSWEEPMTGGSAILGYQVEMETDVTPGWHTIYDGSLDPNVKHLVLENLTYGTTYFYNVYAINAIGRSKPISTAYTVAEPLEKTFFYPLATDPSIPNATLPDAIVADIPTELVILAKNPVTKRIEEGSTHRNYLAAIYDACELNVMRSLCLPVPEQHPDYQDHRQRVKRTPDCCHVTTANGDGTYSLTYTGNKTGIYSLMVYTIFPNGLWGQYWDNNWFYGLPVVSRVDSEIHFQWGQQEVTALAGDHITARWVGFLQGPSTNEYTIYVKADDSVKVWIQGELVVDYWDSEEPCCPEHWTRQNLVKDQFYSIRVDWKEVQGNAQLRLMWGVTGKRKQIIPSQYLWRGAPLENTPYRIVVVPGEPSAVTSGLVEPLERVRSSVKQIVYFEALDVRGNTVNSTNVTFEAYFYFLGSNDTLPLIFRSTPLMLKRRSADEWLHDHLHYMEFVLMQPGNYTLELYLQDIGQLANSPLEIMAMQDDVQPQMCTVSGPGALSFTAGVETNFTLQLRDAFGNAVPHIDGIEVTVDLAFVEEINPNGTLNDRQFRNLTGGHYTTANSITKGPHGSYFITYTGLRAGLNVLTVKVNGLLIAGEQEQVYYNPPVQGQNSPLDLIGYYNHRADGQMTIFSPARLPTVCTSGLNCIVVFHMRDAYGNRMLDDFSAQLWYHIVDANCDPRDPYDPLCVPVDQGVCVHLFGEMHSCDLIPTVGGQFLLRLLVNGQDASFGTWSESVFIYTLEAPYTQGPTSLLVNIGDINATTSTMEGPGLDLAGNVVGVPVNVMVQMKDQYGNNRIVTGNDFQQRRTTVIASLGDTVLATEVHENGTITVTVQTLLAGYHRLRVRMGFGCFQADPVDLCDDISGSPSQLLWWKAAEVSENGMTCETPYIFEAGTQYHFTCTGRDVFSNLNPDYQLQLTADFEYIQAPEGREPLDGWFRGNASANFNQSFVGTYSAADSVYHFEPTVYRAGFYSIKIYLQRPEGGTAVLVLPNNVLALGRPAGDETIIVCVPSTPSPMSSVVVPFVTASATIANEVELQTRDRFGNAIEVSYGDIFQGLLYGQPQTSISFVHLFQGRFRGVLVPTTSGETLIDFMVNGESILGSPFDFVVTPGPMRIERSLVEGFPTEVTAGKLSCWNITLRDGNGNHRMSGLFPDSTDLEEVTCSDPESFCNHTELNGTFTCCINKTRIQDGDNNFRVDEFPFACQVRGDNIDPEVNVKLNPHPLSPLWPDSSNKTGYGMLGPYDFPAFLDEATGWKDWPSVYFRRVQNQLSEQPQHRNNVLRLWYADGFLNAFKGNDSALLLCEVKGPHTLKQRTLGRPTRSLYRLPYVLNQEIGVFEVSLDFLQAGYHKVFCSVAVRGGVNVLTFPEGHWMGTETRQVHQEINITSDSTTNAFDGTPPPSARWDTIVLPPTMANYTFTLRSRGKEATLIFENQLRATVHAVGELNEDLETSIGPLNLKASEPYVLQIAWTSRASDEAQIQLFWESDGGMARSPVPSMYLYHSKTLLLGYPKTVNVTDVPGPVQSFERLEPYEDGKVRLRWTPPLQHNGKDVVSYRLKHDEGLGGDFITDVEVEVTFLTFDPIIPASFTDVTIPVANTFGDTGPPLDPTKLYRFELRASNDDRTDRDLQLDGGGISDQPLIIAVHPLAQVAAPLLPVLQEAEELSGNEGFVRIRISPSGPSNPQLTVEYRVYGSYLEDGVFPPLQLWESALTPLETVDATVNLTTGRTFVLEVAWRFALNESLRSERMQLVCCYMTPPDAPPNLRRKPGVLGLEAPQMDDRITVIWDTPVAIGDRFITHYQVNVVPVLVLESGDILREAPMIYNTASATIQEMQLNNLVPGEIYNISVSAVSAAGIGPLTSELELRACNYSTAPRDVHVADQSTTSIVLAWTEPLVVGAAGLREYLIYVNVSTTSMTPSPYLIGSAPPGSPTFNVTGWSYVSMDSRLRRVRLIPGRSYDFFVEAKSAAGVGPASRSMALTAFAASKPSVPQEFAVDLQSLSKGLSILSWSAPASDGSTPITGYRVQRRKIWSGTFLTQCSVLINNLGDDGGVCLISNFSDFGSADREMIFEQPGRTRLFNGRIAVRNVERTASENSISCSTEIFGDPLFPTASFDPGLNLEPLRECYVLVENCNDEMDCTWYIDDPSRCVNATSTGNSTSCCTCGGGQKQKELAFCAKEGGSCSLNSSTPSFAGSKADYSDGVTPVYFGKLESVLWNISDSNGAVACSRAIGATELTGISVLAYTTQQYCYVLETSDDSWMELSSENYTSTDTTYSDVRGVMSHQYLYRAYATNGADAGATSMTEEISVVIGGLPDAPETFVLGSDQMSVRISWLEPPGRGLPIHGYRVYVDGSLAYDGSTDSVTREFTLLNCTRGALHDLAVAAVTAGGETLVPTVITRHCARRPYRPDPPRIVSVDCRAEATPERGLIENHIRIAYDEPADNGGRPLTGWRIQRAAGQSLSFRGVGPLFPIPENEVVFDDYNDLDGAGRIGLVHGEIYKYRVVAVNDIDEWDDESASDYTIVRCANEALPTPWWLLLNETSTSTSTTMASIMATSSVVTGFVWPTEMETTSTTTLSSVNSTDAFYKLMGLDPLDSYLQDDTVEDVNVSQSILDFYAQFTLPTPPILRIAWTGCNATSRGTSPCATYFPGRLDITGCVGVEFEPNESSLECPMEGYEIYRNEELVASLAPEENGFVDGFTDLTLSASNRRFPGTVFSCYVTVPNTNIHDKQLYKIRSKNCKGWGPYSSDVEAVVISPPAQVCGQWTFDSSWQYICTSSGLIVTPLSSTSVRFDWTLLQEAPFTDIGSNFSRVQEQIGQVGPGVFLTLGEQLIGSYDPRMLLGYELFLDDGLGGPFELVFDGKSRRWTKTATITRLTPGRDYRAFVRAVSVVGNGDASHILYFKMAMPLPPPVILNVETVALKSSLLTWEIGEATVEELAITHYVVEQAIEPDFNSWFAVPNSPADNTQYSLLITQLEPDFKYALRVTSASINGLGLPSEPYYFWAGLLPTEGARLVQRVQSAEGIVTIQWEFPSGDMLGTGTRMEGVTTDWGVKGYMWDPKEQPSLVYNGFGNPTQVQFSVANATCGGNYLVALSIITMIGEGPMSTPLAVTNARLPGVPRNVKVTNTTTSSIALAWEEPEDTGCVPIHQYRILRYYGDQGFKIVGYAAAASGTLQIPAAREYVDDGRCFVDPGVVDDGSCNCPPSCFTTGELYRFQVQACVLGAYGDSTLELTEGPLGCGPNSGTVSAYAADRPGAVRDIRLGEPEGTEILLSWTAPSTDGMNGSIFSYEVELDQGGIFVSLGNTTETSFRVENLQLQFAYVFRISSQNSAGYVTRSNIFSYSATSLPDPPDPPAPIPRAEWVSSAFFMHPTIASTPVPEGVTLRFSPTAVNGYAWAVVMTEANASNITVATLKAGSYAVGGALCIRQRQVVTRGTEYLWRLGSDDDPTDPTGCFLEHGGKYAVVVYVQSVESFNAGIEDGTLSGGVYFTVITGLSNTFSSSPHLNSPLTESGVTLAFTPRRDGFGWAMILSEAQARNANKEMVYDLIGALGGPFCKHGPRQLFANREEAWVFSGCLLTVGSRYTVLAYISGIGAHLDGIVETASAGAREASNAFSTYPTISGAPSGDGITVQLRTRAPGYLWLIITVGPVALTIDLIKAGTGAVGSTGCRLLQQYVDVSLQSFRLSGCKLNSGPEYALHAYIEGSNTQQNDGSFAGTVTFQVTPSNIFVVYPSIVSEITGLGFSFQMTASFTGRFWCMVNEGNIVQSVEDVKLGTGALGTVDCKRTSELLSGSLQEILMTNCQLSQDRLYSLFVYIEDFNGNNDGIMAGPLTFYVQDSNDFEDSPQVVARSAEPEGFQVTLMTAREGFAWGAAFTNYAEAEGYYQNVPSFLDRFYPTNSESCSPMGIPVFGENVTNITFTNCGFNYSTTYWALIYIEGLAKTRSGAMSAPVEVQVPASNTYDSSARILTARPYYADFELSTVKSGYLWIIIVHMNYTNEVNEVAVKTGSLPSGNTVNCKLMDVEVNETIQTYRVENCFLMATVEYYAFFYAEGPFRADDADGILEGPLLVWYNASNTFTQLPRIRSTITTNIFYFSFIPEKDGNFWAVVTDPIDEAALTIWNIKAMQLGQPAGDCRRARKFVTGGLENTEEFLFCYFERGPKTYRAFVYLEDTTESDDGIMVDMGIIVPGAAEVSNEFSIRPYLVQQETIRGIKFTFRPTRTGYAWAGLIAESSWATRLAVNNSNGNHADSRSIEIYDIMFFVDMVGDQNFCYKQAIAITAGQDYTYEFTNCGLLPGTRYRLFVYVIGEDYWDVAVDPDALTRSPFWNIWHRDNGRVSNGVLVDPEYSNYWAWPDGHPSISFGPHGMGMDVTFGTAKPQGLVWAVIQDAADTNFTMLAVKAADKAWGPFGCRQMGVAAPYAATYTLTLSSCSLLPTPKLYVLIMYTEDQAAQNDGKLSDPIYFQVPVSNGFIIQPSLVGEPGVDTGVSISFEARIPGKVWIYVATQASADATTVTIPNVKDAVNVFDRSNCFIDGLTVPAALQVITMPCPVMYLSSYVIYIYIEDQKAHFDGTLSTPLSITVGASNSFEVEPALLTVPTTDRVDVRFTPKKRGRAWVVVTPAASLVEPPSRARMVANVGAVGGLTCRVSGQEMEATQQSYSLTACQLDPGQIYALYVYVEDHRFNTDGTLSRTVFVKVIRSNNFAVSPVLLTLPTFDGFDIRFQATVAGRAWAMAVDAIGGSGVTSLSIRSLQGALGGPECYFQDVPIDDSIQIWNFTNCQFQDMKTYMMFVYVEAFPSVEGDGMLSGPMIASFFDSSNLTADESSNDQSPVLIVENIPIVSNWFREDPRQTGPASPNGATVTFRAAETSGLLFMLLTRYRPQVSSETVYNGWNAVGGPGCQKQGVAIDAQAATVQLSECGLKRGRYYYAYAYVTGPEGGLNGTLSPAVEIFVPTASNNFASEPRLLATPRLSGITFSFAATQEFGLAWVMLVEAWKAHELTIAGVKSFTNAVGNSNCRRASLSISTATKEVILAESSPNAGDGCGLVSDGMYVVAVYVEDVNGLNDGTLGQLPIHVSPQKAKSNLLGAGPMMASDPTSSLVTLKFVATNPGRYWAFILPSDRINVFTIETAKFMDLNPDTVGQASCRKNEVSMGTGETLVELTNCDLVLSGAGITFYSAFVYVEDNSGAQGDLSPAIAVLSISNTFLYPYPRIAAFDTNGTLSVEVFPRNSGRIWARIVLASLYSTVERFSGDLNLNVLKTWESYPNNGPSWENGNCSFDAVDFTVGLDPFGSQAVTWLNFSNCTFDPRTDYMIGIYVEDANNNNDGDISSIRVLKLADASSHFLISPRLVGIAYADNFTMEYRTAAPGFAWCAIVLPEMVSSVPGASVMAGDAGLGSPTCCQSSTPIEFMGNALLQWTLTNCSLAMDTEYVFLMYISTGGLDGTLSSGYTFKTFGTLGHIRVTWLQKETDVGGAVDRYRIFLNGTQVYDDYSLRGSLEQTRAGSPPRWVRVVDVACTPGLNYQVTLAGRNYAGWSSISEPLITGCFLRPGSISNLREVASYQLSEDRAAMALAWDAPPDAVGADTAYYNVYRDQGLRQASFRLIGQTLTPFFNDTDLDAGRAYGYQVAAVNAFGEGLVSDVLFVQAADSTIAETALSGLLNQANIQLVPAATFGVLDEVAGVVQIYSSDMARELRVDGYSSQRLAHVAAFGPVNLTLEALDLAGNTGEEDPCEESRLEISIGESVSYEFCAGDAVATPLVQQLPYGHFAIIRWRTGLLETTITSVANGWRISLKP